MEIIVKIVVNYYFQNELMLLNFIIFVLKKKYLFFMNMFT